MSIFPQAFALEALSRIDNVETAISELIKQTQKTTKTEFSKEEIISMLFYLSSVAKGGDL